MGPKVAVIGAGVAGSFCASTIKRLRPDAVVTVFEMGRSAGGRMVWYTRLLATQPTPRLAQWCNTVVDGA